MRITQKIIYKHGPIGPYCYTDAPGKFSKDWCIRNGVKKFMRDINIYAAQLTHGLLVYTLAPPDGMYGAPFEEEKNNTKASAILSFDALTAYLKKKADFKKTYNEAYYKNVKKWQAAQVVYDAAIAYALSLYEVLYGAGGSNVFQEYFAQCFCFNDYIFKKIQPITSTSTKQKALPKKDTKESNFPDKDTSPLETFSNDTRCIPKVFGRYKVLGNVIEIREGRIIVGVCQKEENIDILRIWFGDTLVYSNNVILHEDLKGVYPLRGMYKDLYAVTLEVTSANSILFKHKGQVWIEIVVNAQRNITTNIIRENTSIITSLRGNKLVIYDNSTETIGIYPDNTFVNVDANINYIYKTRPHTVVGHYIIGGGSIGDLVSGSVVPINVPSIDYPIGISKDGLFLLSNKFVYNVALQQFKYYTTSFSNIGVFTYNVAIKNGGGTGYIVNAQEVTYKTVSIPSISYDFYLYDENYIVVGESNTGKIFVFDYELQLKHEISLQASIIPPLKGKANLSGEIYVLSTTNELFKIVPSKGTYVKTDITLPHALSNYITTNEYMLVGEYNGDLYGVRTEYATTGILDDVYAYILSDLPHKTPNITPTSYIMSDCETSFIDYAVKKIPFGLGLFMYYNGYDFELDAFRYGRQDNYKLVKERKVSETFKRETIVKLKENSFGWVDNTYTLQQISVPAITKCNVSTTTTFILDKALAEKIAQTFKTRPDVIGECMPDNTTMFALMKNLKDITCGGETENMTIDLQQNACEEQWTTFMSSAVNISDLNFPPITPFVYDEPVFPYYVIEKRDKYTSFAYLNKVNTVISNNNQAYAAVGYLRTPIPSNDYSYMTSLCKAGIEIEFPYGVPTLPGNATYDELVNNPYKNLVCIGGKEYVQYQTITPLSGNRVRLDGLLRSRFATAIYYNTHQTGETVLFFRDAQIVKTQYNTQTPLPKIIVFGYEIITNERDDAILDKATLDIIMGLKKRGLVSHYTDVINEYWWAGTRNAYYKIEFTEVVRNALSAYSPYTTTNYTLHDVDVFFRRRGKIDSINGYYLLPLEEMLYVDILYTSLKDTGDVVCRAYIGNTKVFEEIYPYQTFVPVVTAGFSVGNIGADMVLETDRRIRIEGSIINPEQTNTRITLEFV